MKVGHTKRLLSAASLLCLDGMMSHSVMCQVVTAVSTKVQPEMCKSVRDNVEWHYG